MEAHEVHLLRQDLDAGTAHWWREGVGPGLPGTAMELQVPPHRGAVWVARHWATDRARQGGIPEDVLPDIALLTSELVGNAVVHGSGGEVQVRISVERGDATVEVTDTSSGRPEPRHSGPETPGGHGLRLVAMIATRWGHRPRAEGQGNTVWFCIST